MLAMATAPGLATTSDTVITLSPGGAVATSNCAMRAAFGVGAIDAAPSVSRHAAKTTTTPTAATRDAANRTRADTMARP